ncbi:MAG: hypothetical protein P4L65_03880 [Legionella sp.]|nr:hypothetical protein [Legionella sp.]
MIKKIAQSFLFQRALISGLIYVISLYMAKKMGAVEYGSLAFTIFFIKSLPAMNLGISYGFIFHSYSTTHKAYEASYISGYFLISLIALIIGSVLVSPYIGLFGLMLLAIFILEPVLKMKRIFLFSLFPEFFLISSCALSYSLWGDTGVKYAALVFVILLTQVGFTIYLYRKLIVQSLTLRKKNLTLSWKQTRDLMFKGYTSYLYQLALFFFLFTDRYFLHQYYPDKILGVCMLAFQLCQASLYIMSSWNFSSIIEIGELIKANELSLSLIVKKLLKTAVVGILPLIVVYFVLLQIESIYFKDYPDLSLVFAVIASGLYFSNLASSISPILFFFEKQLASSCILFACVFVVFISYFLSGPDSRSYIMVLEYNYSALAVASIFTIFYALYVLHDVLSKKEVLT